MSAGTPRLSRRLALVIGLLATTSGLACSAATPASLAPQQSPTAAAPSTSPPSVAPAPKTAVVLGTRWTQAWSDSFTGPAGQQPSTADWAYDTGQGVFGTGEVEKVTSSAANVHLDGQGHLFIVPLLRGMTWTSGRIQTKSQFAAPAGGEMMVTASIVQPNPTAGVGYWPGFWLISPGRKWPAGGEIDILEAVNAARQEAGTMHCGNTTEPNPDGTMGPCHESTGLTSQLRPCPDCQSAYNTYSLVIDRRDAADESVSWYIGGYNFFTVHESQVGAAAWNQAIDHGFSIVLDVAMGGGFPNVRCHCTSPLPATTSGAPMGVDYVSVYTN